MGYPYHELILPAIMLEKPGLTWDELLDTLDQTHYSEHQRLEPDSPWDAHLPKEPESYQVRLRKLAEWLRLGDTQAFKEFQSPKMDKGEFMLRVPRLEYLQIWEKQPAFRGVWVYQVTTHLGNNLGSPQMLKILSPDEIKVGEEAKDVEELFDEPTAYITRILGQIRRDEDDWFFDEIDPVYQYYYTLELTLAEPILKVEIYRTEDELYKAWPQFGPEFKYDFDQPRGQFEVSRTASRYMWLNQGGRYYFDPSSFDQMDAGFRTNEDRSYLQYGYTDLIVTAEAIKKRAWKLLSRRGRDFVRDFFTDFPDSRERYEQAVWDAHTSLAAKKKGMSNTQFIRLHAAPFLKLGS